MDAKLAVDFSRLVGFDQATGEDAVNFQGAALGARLGAKRAFGGGGEGETTFPGSAEATAGDADIVTPSRKIPVAS